MENEKLIQAITDEVMKRLMDMLKVQNLSQLLHKKNILVIGDPDNSLLNEEIKTLYNVDFYSDMKNMDNYDLVIVEKLSNLELVNLSLGLPGGEKEKLIIESMLKGKTIGLLSDGIEFKRFANTCNKNFYKMYESYEKKIIEFGISIVGHNNIKSFIENNNAEEGLNCNTVEKIVENDNLNKFSTCADLSHKKLLSETDLRRVVVDGNKNVKISMKTIVTPLAKDFIRMNRLNVIKE